jgi:superfamily I DNA/RNA helicase
MPTSRHVIGPPGTGKTHWITQQIGPAIEEFGERKVAVCSLTRAAAAEAASRTGLRREQVGTLHSFCYREACSDAPIFETDNSMIKEWNDAYGGSIKLQMKKPDDHPLFQSYAKTRSMMVEPMRESDIQFAKLYEDFKQQTGCIDFTDMLQRGLDIENMPGRPYHVFIDEAQDMSRLEAEVLRQWAVGFRRLDIVGDPYQNLYEFRGSDSAAMLPKHIIEDDAIILPQSYRVPRAVHGLAMRTIKKNPDYVHIEYNPKDAEGYVKTCAIEDVAQRATEQADKGETVMILAPAAYQLSAITQALRKAGVPFHNPYKKDNGAWNPIREGGIGDKAKAFLQIKDRDRWTPRELKQWVSAITPSKLWRRGRGAAGTREIERILAEDMTDDEIDGAIFDMMTTYMLPDVVTPVASGDLGWFMDNAKGTASLQYLDKIVASGRLNSTPKICVGTIHSVKGGQADHVYVIQDLSPAQFKDKHHTAGALARMFYVAVTRAKQGVTIVKPSTNLGWGLA